MKWDLEWKFKHVVYITINLIFTYTYFVYFNIINNFLIKNLNLNDNFIFIHFLFSISDILDDINIFVLILDNLDIFKQNNLFCFSTMSTYYLKLIVFFFFDIYFNSFSCFNSYLNYFNFIFLINLCIFFIILNLFIIALSIYRLYFFYSRKFRIFHRFLVGWYSGIIWIPLIAYFQFNVIFIFILIYFLTHGLLQVPNSWSYTLLLLFTILLFYIYLFIIFILIW